MSISPSAPTRTGPGAQREQLVTRISEIASAMRRTLEVRPSADERAAWLSLTVHQLEALAALNDATLTMRELCERLDISESAGTALSDRLVARGMVTRQADPDDRRVVRLSLSEDARGMVERYRALKRRRMSEVLSVLEDDDLAILVGICERLVMSASAPQRATACTAPTGAGSQR
jgi:DNA-binding MarR family transcriptional regulator